MVPVIKNRNQWLRIFKIFLPYILIVGIFQAVSAYVLGLNFVHFSQEKLSIFQFSILNISGLVGTVLTLWIFLKFIDKDKFKDLGFGSYKFWDIKVGLLIGFVIMLLSFVIFLIFDEISFLSINFNASKLLLAFLAFTSIALSEEILVRGYVLGNLMKCTNKYYALGWSSIIFSLMHAGNPNMTLFSFFELFMSGILLGISYIYTKNLWFPIALHFSWNFFQGPIFGFNVSGLKVYSVIEHVRPTDNIFNGGAFGYEGSILSVFFQIVAIIIIIIIYKKPQIDEKAELMQATRFTISNNL